MPFHIAEGRGGGAEAQAWYLARELARRGYRTGYIAQSVKGKQGTVESLDGVSIHWIRHTNRFRWSNALAYYQALTRVDADIVIQRMTAFTTGVAAYWCRKHRKKFVWICSDNAAPHKWTFLRLQRVATRSAHVGSIKSAIFLVDALITNLGRNWGMKRVWMAFTQNEAQRNLLKQEFGLESSRMISGHPPPTRLTMPVHEKLRRPLILWAAHLGSKKRPEKFIELARMSENTEREFVMIGGHFDDSRIAELFKVIPKNLRWLGKVPFDEALTLFDRAALFVNTSLPEGEGFPNTFVQAWLRGVPVLSLEVDPDGIIRNNELGLVDSRLEGLTTYMKKLTSQPELYAMISDRAREYATGNLSIARMADNFLQSISAR